MGEDNLVAGEHVRITEQWLWHCLGHASHSLAEIVDEVEGRVFFGRKPRKCSAANVVVFIPLMIAQDPGHEKDRGSGSPRITRWD